MKNKKILLGMLVLVLAFGMSVIGCDDDDGEDSPYKGEWNGTYTPSGGDELGAKIVFTDTAWTITYVEYEDESGNQVEKQKKISGTYKKGRLGPDLIMSGGELGSITVANAIVVSNSLTFTFSLGLHLGGKGSFKREKPPKDSFKGDWTGTYAPTNGSEIENATIVFTDDKWTLNTTPTITNVSGDYEKTLIGTTANLIRSGGDFGTVTVGTAVLNLLTGDLTVTITVGNGSGKGTFTKD